MTAPDLSGPLRRRNYGNGHGYLFGDVKVPGVTTIIGVRDKAALKKWAAGVAADLVANVARIEDGRLTIDGEQLWRDMRALDDRLPVKPTHAKLADGLTWAHNKVRDAAANRGSEVHRIVDAMHDGGDVQVPDELTGHVDAYLDWWERCQPEEVMSERSIGSRRWGGWGGTFDVVATLPNLSDRARAAFGLTDDDGPARALLDYKTSGSGVFGDTALQLAGYRYSDVYLDDDGAEQPTADLGINCAGVLWLRADGWDLYPYRVGPDELNLFAYCRAVYSLWLEPWKERWNGPGDKPKYADMAWSNTVKGDAFDPADLGEVD